MPVNFELLSKAPQGAKLLPDDGPGQQLFAASQRSRALDIQEASVAGSLFARGEELKEKKRSSLASEADRAEGRDIQRSGQDIQRAGLAERVRQFDLNLDLDKKRVDLLGRGMDLRELQRDDDLAKFDITEARKDKEFAAGLDQFEKQFSLQERQQLVREGQYQLQREEIQRRIQSEEDATALKQGARQAFQQGGSRGLRNFYKQNGLHGELFDLDKTMIANEKAMNDFVASRDGKGIGAHALANSLANSFDNFSGEARAKQVLGGAARLGRMLGRTVPFKDVTEAESYVMNTALTAKEMVQGIQEAAKAKPMSVEDVFYAQNVLDSNSDGGREARAQMQQLENDIAEGRLDGPQQQPSDSGSEQLSLIDRAANKRNFESLASGVKKGIQDSEIGNKNIVLDLNKIAKDFDPKFLQAGSDFNVGLAKVADKFGVASEEQRRAIIGSINTKNASGRFLANYLKVLSGANVTDVEFKRVAGNTINGNMSPTEFQASLDGMRSEATDKYNRARDEQGKLRRDLNPSASVSGNSDEVARVDRSKSASKLISEFF